ncbi:uncharacterized protein (DUF2147 family) [Pacificibacter maritimus]|uniref:Uncharacterized protein (DUF2147 family) n=1 Tax=Pacificibacter maritimus TaxID=762213 RepID=A0A3N4UWL7_9RHOB|nr:DUF2147 domain-containing protein [Pacificibacter maritimus]RPE71951.1 uncharacterized protein (DUF2147 family) [Pacificibacter maritimus]
MKVLKYSVFASVLFALPALADPVFGVWKTAPDGLGFAHVSMAPCGDAICATILQTFDMAGQPASMPDGPELIGTQVLWDMQPAGAGRYTNGKIYQPSTKRTFASKMQVSEDILTVSGCLGPICERQTWTRVSQP